MRVVINTAHQRFGGAVQVALSFINECMHYKGDEFIVWVGPGLKELLDIDSFPSNFTFTYFDFGVINLFTTFVINYRLKKEETIVSPDVIIATSGPTYFHSRAPQIIGFNLPLYIYNDSPYVNYMPWRKKLVYFVKRWIHFYFFKRDGSGFLAQTDDVNRRVRIALDTDRVHTVTNTHSSYYANWQPVSTKLPMRIGRVFRLVAISAFYRHKNLEIIPEVLKVLRLRGFNHVQFVLTLPDSDYQKLLGCHSSDGMMNVGPLLPIECPSIYAQCDALFLPTLAECFSAAYPEAMVMRKPIITTDLDFAHAICGDAALYFGPKDPVSAADAIERLLMNPELSDSLVQNGIHQLTTFDTAGDRARKYLDICSDYVTK